MKLTERGIRVIDLASAHTERLIQFSNGEQPDLTDERDCKLIQMMGCIMMGLICQRQDENLKQGRDN